MGLQIPQRTYYATAANTPGLFDFLTPQYQLASAQAGIANQQLAASQAFSGGVPTDANGNVDYGAMAKTLFQKGDIGDASALLGTGVKQQAIAYGLNAAKDLANGGSAQPATPASPSPTSTYTKPTPGFDSAVSRTFGFEGGYNPSDTNGTPTNYGINQAANPGVDVANLTQDQAKQIYKTNYWDAIGGDNLSPAMSRAAFDTAVVMGPAKAKELIAQSGGDPMKLMTLREQYQQNLIQSDPAKYAPYAKAWNGRNNGLRYDILYFNQQGNQAGSGALAQTSANADQDGPPPGSQHPYAPSKSPTQMPGQSPSAMQVAGPGAPGQAPGPGAPTTGPGAPMPLGPGTAAGGTVPVGPAPNPTNVPGQQQGASAGTGAGLIDPSMGGLLKGPWLNNPGGYVAKLRGMAVNLATLGNADAASAYGKQADFVERAIERNNIITPEMKNYQIAVGQGFQGSMMDYARQLEVNKLTAPGDPGAVRAAGQLAQAQADARNASDVAAAGQKAEQTGEGTYLGQLPGKLASAADNAKLQSNLVSEMLDAGNAFRMGPGAATQQNFNLKLSALGDALGVDTSGLKSQAAGYAEFSKLGGQLVRQSIRETGSSRAGVQEMQMVSGSLPSPDMSKDGFRSVANQIQGLNDYTLAKQQAGQSWLDQNHTMAGFEAGWNKNISPAAFVLHRLQADQPDLFTSTVQRMAQTPQGRGVLANVKSGLAWGGQQGLF